MRGFSREIFALIGLVGGVAVAGAMYGDAAVMLPPEVPEIVRPAVAFGGVFLGVALAAKLVGMAVHRCSGSRCSRRSIASPASSSASPRGRRDRARHDRGAGDHAAERARKLCAGSVLMQPILAFTDDAARRGRRRLPTRCRRRWIAAASAATEADHARPHSRDDAHRDPRSRQHRRDRGAHVGLKRVGRNQVGLCPFHAEKSPSFTVNDERGIFHCFGCGAGGNVFTFLMKMENATFPEVVERLARRYGITLPERGEDDPAIRRREALFRLNEKAARFFQRYLWDAAEAEAARKYLQERGIGRETADHFLLGYAPAGGDVLARRLRDAAGSDPELGKEGRPLVLAHQLGLVGERKSGLGHYDRFRARLMFPITDSAGRVVGFGSRSIPGTSSEDAKLPST